MAHRYCTSLLLIIVFFFFFFFNSLSLSTQINTSLSLSFPLITTRSLSHHPSRKLSPSLSSSQPSISKLPFKYSMALIISLPIGTPPQAQQMVLDTGSQLSWIQCHNRKKPTPPPMSSFDPSLSSSFSLLPCTHPLCKPRTPDFTLPTNCDHNLCHYSYFYADGTYAEGNLVKENISLPNYHSTHPLILGCATDSPNAEGILGMNLGRLSFPSQARVSKFSYCIPARHIKSEGSFYLGQNPNSVKFDYINILTFPVTHRMPNFDPLAWTVPLEGIRIGGKRLEISPAVFRPNGGGAGQTMVDSGTEYTFLVREAYEKVREEVLRVVGSRVKKGYVYQESLDLCFDGDVAEIGRLIGDVAFVFEKGVEVVVDKERVLDDVGGGVHCFGIGGSDSLEAPSNIIGNFHQQNLWVEFDVGNRRVGFARADCSI